MCLWLLNKCLGFRFLSSKQTLPVFQCFSAPVKLYLHFCFSFHHLVHQKSQLAESLVMSPFTNKRKWWKLWVRLKNHWLWITCHGRPLHGSVIIKTDPVLKMLRLDPIIPNPRKTSQKRPRKQLHCICMFIYLIC